MRSASFIIKINVSLLALFMLVISTAGQKIAILTPDGIEESRQFAARMNEELEGSLQLLDDDLSAAAYRSVSPQSPFNLTTGESKLIGTTIGCDYFILMKSAIQRRSAFRRNQYYEAYAHLFVVSSRTGRLVFWKNQKFEAANPRDAKNLLDDSAVELAGQIAAFIKTTRKSELNEPPAPQIEEVPDADSPLAKDFRAPIPYRRIKPDYTAEAALYSVTATVEMLVDTDANGAITRTEIARWAGFGLEESVEKAVRAMNWRPAFRGGKPLAMRFLLRYNFKKIDKED